MLITQLTLGSTNIVKTLVRNEAYSIEEARQANILFMHRTMAAIIGGLQQEFK